MKLKMLISAAAVSATAMLYSATTQDECTAYLTQSDPDGKSSFNTSVRWSDNAVPGPGSTNYVGSGLIIRDSGGSGGIDVPYLGDVLALAGTFKGMASGSCKIIWPELRMQNGASYEWSSFSHVYGKVVIESDNGNPAQFVMFHPGNINATILAASFSGGADSCFLLKRSSGNPLAQLPDLKWRIQGDWSKFYGTCRVCVKSQIFFYNQQQEIPGTIIVEDGGYWWFNYGDAQITVGTLELKDGANYWGKCSTDGRSAIAIVTNKLTLGAVNIDFYNKWEYNDQSKSSFPRCVDPGAPVDIALFKLTGAAAEDVPDLTKVTIPDFPDASKSGEFHRHKALVCKDNGDGTKTICARYYTDDPVIKMIKANGSYKETESAFNATGDAVAQYWSPAQVPTSETSGDVFAEKSITWTGNNNYSFPNLIFTVAAGQYAYMQCLGIKAKKIIFAGSGSIQTYSRSCVLDAPVALCAFSSVTNTISVYQKCTLTINGDISGSANLKITAPVPHHNPVGYTVLKGGNADFHGAFMLMTSSHPEDTVNSSGTKLPKFPDLAKDMYLQLTVSRGDQFGGRYDGADAWKSIRINNYGCVNIADADVVVNEPTRGLFVDGGAQFNVPENLSLTLDIPVTYGGELLKNGAGALVLGGEARFIDGLAETMPQEGTNVLTLAAGSLKVISANALNGVMVKFNKGTHLRLDAAPASFDMAAYGIVNTRWNVPFVCEEDDGAIRVQFENIEAVEQLDRFTCAICTVAADVAPTLGFKVPRIRNFLCDIVRCENADGTVTIAAEYTRRGRLFIKMR